MHDSQKSHMEAVERILNYLKSAPRNKLLFKKFLFYLLSIFNPIFLEGLLFLF